MRTAKHTQLTIKDARQACELLNAKGVIILAFSADDGGEVAGASYGVTRRGCKRFAKLLDLIVDAMTSGEISDLDGFKGNITQ